MVDFVAVCKVEWWFDGEPRTDYRAFTGSNFSEVATKIEDYYGKDEVKSISIEFIDETIVPLTEEFAQYLLDNN